MNRQLLVNILLGILTGFLSLAMTITLGVSGWGLMSIIALDKQLDLLEQRVDNNGESIAINKRQDESLSKHWELHGWAREEINELQKNAGAPLSKWPDLND